MAKNKDFEYEYGDGDEIFSENITTFPMSPCVVGVIDGNLRIVGYVLYRLESDNAIPVIYDGKRNALYSDWFEGGVPLVSKTRKHICTKSADPPKTPCMNNACVCNTVRVRLVPITWAQNRQKLIAEGRHWLQDTSVAKMSEFSEESLVLRETRLVKINDTGKNWKQWWEYMMGNTNPTFAKLKKLVRFMNPDPRGMRGSFFDWNRLPLTAFEVISDYLDGVALRNFCSTSLTIESRMKVHLGLFEEQKRERMYRKYCLEDFDRSTVLKILASFDAYVRHRETNDRAHLIFVKWEIIFGVYRSYWPSLTRGKVEMQRMKKLEEKLRDGEIIRLQEMDREESIFPTLIQRPLGGRAVFSMRFPNTSTKLNRPVNLSVLEDFENPLSNNVALACLSAKDSSSFQVKVAHFPILREELNANDIPEMEKVILSLCNNCMTTSAIGGWYGATRKWPMPEETDMDERCIEMDPIFEIKDNILAIWYRPTTLAFYILAPTETGNFNDRGYEPVLLYRLEFPKMKEVWNKLALYRSYYLPVITEHKGDTKFLDEGGKTDVWRGGSEYIFHPKEPTYYGLALVSPIYGIESFKPPTDSAEETVVESIEPQVFLENGRNYLKAMRKPKCSTKGHGMYVFCSDNVIAISWDCIVWLFTDLFFPPNCKQSQCLKSVEVLHENGLMFVLNDCIVLMEVTVESEQLGLGYKFDVCHIEPSLVLQPVRVLKMGFDCSKMEISYAELNFDSGLPFIFIIADRKLIKIQNKDYEKFGYEVIKEFPDFSKRMIFRLEF